MRVASVVGARSDLFKCAPVARALVPLHDHFLVHTGHGFDYGTTPVFFSDLEIAPPAHDLGLGRGSNAAVLREMLERLAPLLKSAEPDWVLVYGSSAATLAATLVAAKLGLPVGHVEAGVRSYRRSTPDELNHIVVDHMSRLHFCPTALAVATLEAEGLTEGLFNVGDVVLDNIVMGWARVDREISEEALFSAVGIDTKAPFAFATIHQLENTQDDVRLGALIDAFSRLPCPVILPLHPRTQESLTERPELVSRIGANVNIVDPLRPLITLAALRRAKVVLTDSGSLQREAYYIGVPCVTLRDDTEWVETLDLSANRVVGADAETILRAFESAASVHLEPLVGKDGPFGRGDAGQRIVQILEHGGEGP